MLVAGAGCKAVADQAAAIGGVRKFFSRTTRHTAINSRKTSRCSSPNSARSYSHVLTGHTTAGQELPAARRRTAQRRADLRHHRGRRPDTFKRPIYAGNGIATIKSNDAIKVAVGSRHRIRSGCMRPADPHRSKTLRASTMRACRRSSANRSSKANARN